VKLGNEPVDELILLQEWHIDNFGESFNKQTALYYLERAHDRSSPKSEPLLPGQPIDVKPVPWLWEGMIMKGDSNLIIAPPKVGKSALVVGLVGAMARGESHFLGKRLDYGNECPPVFIYGTDQPGSCWAELFAREGLLNADKSFAYPIVKLARAGDSLVLNKEGLEKIEKDASANPGCIQLFDSYATLAGPLGHEEASPAFAQPCQKLRDMLAKHGVTWAMLHHSNKSVSGGNAINASRGTNALPALFSWTLLMNWLRLPVDGTVQNDFRVVVSCSGRAKSTSLLCELQGDGTSTHWEITGDAEAAQAAEYRADQEDRLSGKRQGDALQYLKHAWNETRQGLTSNELASRMGNVKLPVAHGYLDGLLKKGLIKKSGSIQTGGRPADLYYWVEAVTPDEAEGNARFETGEKGLKSEKEKTENQSYRSISSFSDIYGAGTSGKKILNSGVVQLDPLPEGLRVGAKVQKQNANGGWDERPFVIAEAPNEHNVTVALLGNSMLRFSAQRWNAEIRAWPAPIPDEAKSILELNEPF